MKQPSETIRRSNCFSDAVVPHTEIPLTQGKSAVVDEVDFQKLADLSWHAKCGKRGRWVAEHSFYDRTQGRVRNVLMHRFLLSPPDHFVIDHINGDALDNRRINLRVCTSRQNSLNAGARGKTGYSGVVKSGSGWRARIAPEGMDILLGWFEAPVLAAAAYNKAATIIYGEFARLNDVPELSPSLWAEILAEKNRSVDRMSREIELLNGMSDSFASC